MYKDLNVYTSDLYTRFFSETHCLFIPTLLSYFGILRVVKFSFQFCDKTLNSSRATRSMLHLGTPLRNNNV